MAGLLLGAEGDLRQGNVAHPSSALSMTAAANPMRMPARNTCQQRVRSAMTPPGHYPSRLALISSLLVVLVSLSVGRTVSLGYRVADWLVRPDLHASPGYRQAVEEQRRAILGMVLAIDQMMTDRQRRHALQKLQELISESAVRLHSPLVLHLKLNPHFRLQDVAFHELGHPHHAPHQP